MQDYEKKYHLVSQVAGDCMNIAKQFDSHQDLKELLLRSMEDDGTCGGTRPRIPCETRFGGFILLMLDILKVWPALVRTTLSDVFRSTKHQKLKHVQVPLTWPPRPIAEALSAMSL
jgi:hypothetical protein